MPATKGKMVVFEMLAGGRQGQCPSHGMTGVSGFSPCRGKPWKVVNREQHGLCFQNLVRRTDGGVRSGMVTGRQLFGNWNSPGARGVGQVLTVETEGHEEKQLKRTGPLQR